MLQFNEKTKGFHMRYHLFLHYGWFLQNLEKDFIRTNRHTTVNLQYRYYVPVRVSQRMTSKKMAICV